METYHLDGLNVPVSRFVYGTATREMMAGGDAGDVLDAAFDAGITTFDSAASYGDSEVGLGNWIRERGNRGRVNILTKGCAMNSWRDRVTPYDFESDLTDSLAKLRVDWIDIYLLHRDDVTKPVEPIIDILNKYHEKGLIRAIGGSNWSPERIREANAYAVAQRLVGFTVSSPSFSLAEQIGDPYSSPNCRSVCAAGPNHAEDRKWFRRTNLLVVAYSGLARGFLSGKFKSKHPEEVTQVFGDGTIKEYFYPENMERLRRAELLSQLKDCSVPEICLAWTLKQDFRVCPIISPSTLEHLKKDLNALNIPLTAKECEWLNLESGEI